MNKNLQDATAHTSARRRLVRGAFAAPVALTLYSGGAFAATSMSCVVKEVNHPTHPAALTSPSDTYLRVQLWTLPSETPSAWINGSDIAALQLQVSATLVPYITSSQWQCFVIGSPTGVMINMTSVVQTAGTIYNNQPSYDTSIPTKNGSYVAIRINASGEIVGVVQDGGTPTNTSAVHQSCWASFKPGP